MQLISFVFLVASVVGGCKNNVDANHKAVFINPNLAKELKGKDESVVVEILGKPQEVVEFDDKKLFAYETGIQKGEYPLSYRVIIDKNGVCSGAEFDD